MVPIIELPPLENVPSNRDPIASTANLTVVPCTEIKLMGGPDVP